MRDGLFQYGGNAVSLKWIAVKGPISFLNFVFKLGTLGLSIFDLGGFEKSHLFSLGLAFLSCLALGRNSPEISLSVSFVGSFEESL